MAMELEVNQSMENSSMMNISNTNTTHPTLLPWVTAEKKIPILLVFISR
jgi:hypothetical protein